MLETRSRKEVALEQSDAFVLQRHALARGLDAFGKNLNGQLIAQAHDAGNDSPAYAIGVYTARQSHIFPRTREVEHVRVWQAAPR